MSAFLYVHIDVCTHVETKGCHVIVSSSVTLHFIFEDRVTSWAQSSLMAYTMTSQWILEICLPLPYSCTMVIKCATVPDLLRGFTVYYIFLSFCLFGFTLCVKIQRYLHPSDMIFQSFSRFPKFFCAYLSPFLLKLILVYFSLYSTWDFHSLKLFTLLHKAPLSFVR